MKDRISIFKYHKGINRYKNIREKRGEDNEFSLGELNWKCYHKIIIEMIRSCLTVFHCTNSKIYRLFTDLQNLVLCYICDICSFDFLSPFPIHLYAKPALVILVLFQTVHCLPSTVEFFFLQCLYGFFLI